MGEAVPTKKKMRYLHKRHNKGKEHEEKEIQINFFSHFNFLPVP